MVYVNAKYLGGQYMLQRMLYFCYTYINVFMLLLNTFLLKAEYPMAIYLKLGISKHFDSSFGPFVTLDFLKEYLPF